MESLKIKMVMLTILLIPFLGIKIVDSGALSGFFGLVVRGEYYGQQLQKAVND